MMKKAVDRFWGLLPFLIFLFCIVFVRLVETTTENRLRILPRNLLICFGMISIGILLLWLNTRKTISVHRIFSFALKIVSIFLIAAVTLTGLFIMGFSHCPEHIVTKNGIKMVASVHSFLDEQVEYYAYKNWFFYGQQLGYEYYGSGGKDPLAQEPKPGPIRSTFYDFDGHVIESTGIH